MSRSKKTGSTQKVGSGSRHISGKSPNTATRKGKEAEFDQELTVPEKHQRKIEAQNARMPQAMLDVLNGGK